MGSADLIHQLRPCPLLAGPADGEYIQMGSGQPPVAGGEGYITAGESGAADSEVFDGFGPGEGVVL